MHRKNFKRAYSETLENNRKRKTSKEQVAKKTLKEQVAKKL